MMAFDEKVDADVAIIQAEIDEKFGVGYKVTTERWPDIRSGGSILYFEFHHGPDQLASYQTDHEDTELIAEGARGAIWDVPFFLPGSPLGALSIRQKAFDEIQVHKSKSVRVATPWESWR